MTSSPPRPASSCPDQRPRPQERLDLRRRRLGLRHRLRWARPCPVVGPQCQHLGARHRGLLKHRRASLEGDPTRRYGQVRRRRQRVGQKRPRSGGPCLRQRVRRPDFHGSQRPAGHQGVARSRGLSRHVARDRLFDLYRPRDRHGQVHEPPERRRAFRLLAPVPLPPSDAEAGHPFKLDSKAPSIRLADFVATEARYATLARTHPQQAARLAALAQADVTERWRYYEQLAAMQRTVP